MGLGLDSSVGFGIGRLQDGLLMPCTLAQHAVQAESDEQGDQRENDDCSQRFFRSKRESSPSNIMPTTFGFKGRSIPLTALRPD
jgi:hypothetical protein